MLTWQKGSCEIQAVTFCIHAIHSYSSTLNNLYHAEKAQKLWDLWSRLQQTSSWYMWLAASLMQLGTNLYGFRPPWPRGRDDRRMPRMWFSLLESLPPAAHLHKTVRLLSEYHASYKSSVHLRWKHAPIRQHFDQA